MTGAVNVIEHKADLSDVSAYVQGEGGSNEYRRFLAIANWAAPGGHFAARVAATLREADGFVDNLGGGPALGGYEVRAGRAAFAFAPKNDMRFDLILNVHQDNNAGTAFKSGTFAPLGGNLSYFTPAALNRSVPGFEDGRPIGLDREVDSATLIGQWRLNANLTVNSLSGLRSFDSLDIFDADGSSMPLLFGSEQAQGRQLSQELRLIIDHAGPVSGFIGAAFMHERASQRVATVYNEHFFLPLLLGVMHGPNAQTQAQADGLSLAVLGAPYSGFINSLDEAHSEYYENTSTTDALDIFADLTFAVTDRFDVSGGLRYSRDDKTTGLEAGLLGGPSQLASLFAPHASSPLGLFIQPQAPIQNHGQFEGASWRLASSYRVSDGLTLWGSYALGRTPSVISLTPGNLPGSHSVEEVLPEEEVRSFELGLHSQSAAHRLRLDASFFNYDYTDFQTTAIIAGAFQAVNAGQARAFGAEFNLEWRVARAWRLIGAYAYNQARFASGARDGNHFRLSPDHSIGLGVIYEHPVARIGGVVSFNGFYDWRSKVFFDNDNDRRDLQPPLLASVPSLRDRAVDEYQDAYGLLNLRADYHTDADRWSFGVFINNALNERYLLDAGNVGDSFTIPTFIRGPGRLWGLNVARRL